MSVEVRIKNRNLFKRKININDLIFDDIRYGIMDEAFRLEENKIGENIVIFDHNHICRGFEISLNSNEVYLRMPLPTSNKDVEFFYNYIKKVCSKLKSKTFIREDTIVYLDQIDEFINIDIDASKNALKQIQDRIESKEMNNIYFFGAINPICIGKKEIDIIDNSPRKLGELLNELQTKDIYYAKANIYQRKDQTYFGIYVLSEKVPSVLPLSPKLMMPNKDIKINDWYLCFVANEQMIGQINYSDFISNLTDEEYYDSEHFIITLDKIKMEDYLDKFKTEID